MAIGRRTFLIGGGAAVGVVVVGAVGGGLLVEEGVLPGRSKLDEVLGRCGSGLEPPDTEPGPVTTGTFTSAARNGTEVGWTVVHPPGATPGDALPVCLFLHGRGGRKNVFQIRHRKSYRRRHYWSLDLHAVLSLALGTRHSPFELGRP